MRQKRFSPFEITSMDSLGQGVSKLGDKVTFIAKTVVGDKGVAEILAERKGVAFAKVLEFSTPSPRRISPACAHFQLCPSCHYQHVDYKEELEFKKESFQKLFRKLPLPEVQVIEAVRRLEYRNRVQLHYSLKSKLLGMRDQSNTIIPIPDCLICLPEVKAEIQRLYHQDGWLKEVPKGNPEGHVEIYWINGQIRTSWNRPYADGGFTQVFEEMNQKLKSILHEEWQLDKSTHLLDLFGGNGNLSNGLSYSRRLCVDFYPKPLGEEFYNQDLYDDSALNRIQSELKKRNINAENLLLDPPRSGLKNLKEWVQQLKPRSVAYVSCDPHTLARDVGNLEGYSVKKAFLIDFFPSTFHFESFLILERNN